MRFFLLLGFFFSAIFSGFTQNLNIATHYLDQGEYVKAEAAFKELYHTDKYSMAYLEGYVKSLQEQEKLDEARELLFEFDKNVSGYPGLKVKIGYNYALQNQPAVADTYYQKALEQIRTHPVFTQKIASDFRKHNLLDFAVKAYKAGLKERFNPSYAVELAQIYGELGELDNMFTTFLDLIERDPGYYYSVNRYFSQYISTDPEDEANQILRTALLKRVQSNPDVLYNHMLSWLYTRQHDFQKAFIQEKAVYNRSENRSLTRIIQLAKTAAEKDDDRDAKDILSYALENAYTTEQKINIHNQLFEIKIKNTATEEYPALLKEFDEVLTGFRKWGSPFVLELQYAAFLALKTGKPDSGKAVLDNLLAAKPDKKQEAIIKMLYADILVTEEKFSQALVYYSQVKSLAKNTPTAQEALFKIAQTSYYKGDFDWAQTQLRILKKATSELTANDAIALNLLIENNTADSTQTALRQIAKSDLLSLQDKNEEALALLNKVLTDNKGTNAEETALLRSARLYESMQDYKKAEAAYQRLIQDFPYSTLADDALFFLAELYRNKLGDNDKAMEYYKVIIFHHADSIFFVEARKQYRILRGDDLQ